LQLNANHFWNGARRFGKDEYFYFDHPTTWEAVEHYCFSARNKRRLLISGSIEIIC